MGFNMIDLAGYAPPVESDDDAQDEVKSLATAAIVKAATPSIFGNLSRFRPAAYKGDSKARNDVVHGRLPAGTVVLLAGAGGSGKSTLLLQIAEAIHCGGEALGGSVNSAFRGLSCILMLGEDSRETLDLRLRVIRVKQGRKPADDLGLYIPCPDLDQSARLVAKDPYDQSVRPTDAFAELEAAIEAETSSHDGVALVAIDTLTALLGVDVNCPEDVQACYNLLTRLARKYGCCILVTHHVNKSAQQGTRERIRGSTAVVDGVRATYVLEQVKKEEAARLLKSAGLDSNLDLLRITLEKDNLGLSRQPILYAREADGYMRDISHLIAAPESLEDSLVFVVRGFNAKGQKVTRGGKSDGLHLQKSADWPKGLQVGRDKLVGLINAAIQAGRLALGDDGGLVAV